MNNKRIQAITLRTQGFSYNEISKELLIPKSTLSSWLKNLELSVEANTRLRERMQQGTTNSLVTRNKLQTLNAQKRASTIQINAARDIGQLSKDDIRIIGTALYWAEGYKRSIVRDGKEITSHAISFVNADPFMIRIFNRFLIEVLEIPSESIIATMRLYAHIDEEEASKFWQTQTGINKSQFRTTTYQVSKSSNRLRPFNRLPYGTLQIGVYQTSKFHQIIGLIEGMKLQAGCDTISTSSDAVKTSNMPR